jgi:hypothetical protein
VPNLTSTPTPISSVVVLAAGDIAACNNQGATTTAALLERISGVVLPLGDNVYETGSAQEYAQCFDPSWGRYKARMRPVPGNHEYLTANASGYYQYFGEIAGDPKKGYYSYNLGSWHLIALNSTCWEVACQMDSEQYRWLVADLAAHQNLCTLAYWHQPRFSSGLQHGSDETYWAFWNALYKAGADVVLNGHEHLYERFAPQTATGQADAQRGIRQFVVGTGGKNHYAFRTPVAQSEVRHTGTFGVLKLTLHPTNYEWEFIPEDGKTFTDVGSGQCH